VNCIPNSMIAVLASHEIFARFKVFMLSQMSYPWTISVHTCHTVSLQQQSRTVDINASHYHMVPHILWRFLDTIHKIFISLVNNNNLLCFCSGILLPVAITVRITWWFISLVDGFFSPIYAHFGVHIFGWCEHSFTLSHNLLASIFLFS